MSTGTLLGSLSGRKLSLIPADFVDEVEEPIKIDGQAPLINSLMISLQMQDCIRCHQHPPEDLLSRLKPTRPFPILSKRKPPLPRKKTILPASKACERCNQGFRPSRKGQRFCSRACQTNSTRTSQRKQNAEKAKRHFARASDLSQLINKTAPHLRLGVMQHILSFVSIDGGLRSILTDPKLLNAKPTNHMRKNITQSANVYVWMFHGISIREYVELVRDGHEVPEVPVKRRRPKPQSAVPNIRHKLRKPKCWHCPVRAKEEGKLVTAWLLECSEIDSV